ncbi:MAG: ATP-binding protein [Gemmatimonas sp.]
MAPEKKLTAETFFEGPGEMRALFRAFDWSQTPLGPVASWPSSLCTTVRTMMASRHPMFLWWGADLVQIYNDAYRPSFGGDGRHLRAIGAEGKKFWTEIWEAIGGQIAQVMSGGYATWHEDQYLPILRNGRLEDVYWTYSYSAAFGDDGEIAGVLVVCQETTAQVQVRKQLEIERSRLAYAFQQAPSFVAVLRGPPYVFEFVNDAYLNLVGTRGELVGSLLSEIVPEAIEQGFDKLLDNVVESRAPFVGKELLFVVTRTHNAPPEERFVDFVYFPLIEADGSCSGVIAHGVDITEQVHARRDVERLLLASEVERQEADRSRTEADAANKAKGDFLAMLSHELRTPLAAISGYAELLAMGVKGELTDGQSEYLVRIQHSQRHLLGLIDGLLIYSQAEAGKTQYRPERIVLDELISSCETITAPQAEARQLSLRNETCDATLTVSADREKTKQIIINLLSNAIKFTEPGGSITVHCNSNEQLVTIAVADTGHGIAGEDLKRIFEPFVQLNTIGTRGKGGTGLGLAISQTLARGMGGDLTVASTVGEGSVFTLTLPVGDQLDLPGA